MAYAHLRTGETRAISRRRQDEDGRLLMSASVAANSQLQQLAHWEINSNKVIRNNTTKAFAKTLEKDAERSLLIRRERLQALLTREDEEYRRALLELNENAAQRAIRLVTHARELKKEREMKRTNFANEQYERQWKMSCDDLRTIDSEYFKLHCNQEVIKQIQNKRDRNERLNEEEERWAALWESDRQAKILAEDTKAAARRSAIISNRAALKQQVEESNEAKARELARIQKEKEELNSLLTNDARALKIKAQNELERKRNLQREIVKYNEKIERERAENAALEKANERATVEEKLEEFRVDNALRAQQLEAARKDMNEYRTYLAAKRLEEKKMEAMMESMVAQELARENAKRDDQWTREQLMREKLMKQVYETREAQLLDKRQRELRAEEERLLEKRAHEWEQSKVLEEEEESKQQERLQILKRKKELEAQMDANSMRRHLDEQRVVREKAAALQQEEEYRLMLEMAKRSTIENAKQTYGLKNFQNRTPI